jgi:hypothetical protein
MLILVLVLRLALFLTNQTFLPSDQIQLAVYASHLPQLTKDTFAFGLQNGYFLFPTNLIILKLLGYQLAQGILIVASTYIFYKLIQLLSPKHALLATIIFTFSPWHIYISSYKFEALLALTLTTLTYYLYKTRSKLVSPILVLAAAASLPALLFSIYISLRQKNIKFKSFFAFIFFALILINMNYIKSSTNASFLGELAPAKLADAVNTKAAQDFKATNQTIVLPSVVRKITYNKVSFASDLIFRKFITFFDFEQWASVNGSFELIKKSGLSPKGNWPALYLWQIPMLIYFLTNQNLKKQLPQETFKIFYISIFVFLVSQKTHLHSTQILLFPLISFASALSVQSIKPRQGYTKIIFSILVAALILVPSIKSIQDFYQNQDQHRYTHEYFYKLISDKFLEYEQSNNQIIITNRFGNTFLAAVYYQKLDAKTNLIKYLNNDHTIRTAKFQAFQIADGAEDHTIYIGLEGEFKKKIVFKEGETPPPNFTILETLEGWDEPVFQYGESLWIAKNY